MRFYNFSLLILLILFFACDTKPKVVKVERDNDGQQIEDLVRNSANASHTVTIEEVLQAEKYTYLNVKEKDETFWIAIPKREVDETATYHYSGGLKKVNFYSKDFERNFPLIYLVSGLHEAHSATKTTLDQAPSNKQDISPVSPILPDPEGISLTELFADKETYSGKNVKVKGKCVKVNNQIMDRNWIHLQDGTSYKGKLCDLTITTQEIIPLGATVSLEGKIALQKDFGAGYRYEIILEDANLK